MSGKVLYGRQEHSMSAESPRHVRSGGPLTVPSQPPSDRSIIDAVSGFINDVTLSSSSTADPKDVIQWARFETADINEPTPEGDSDNDISPLLLILGYGAGVQVWLIPPTGEAQEVLSWRQGTVRVLRILPTPQHGDCFASKRPLIALCDSASPGPSFCSLSFISIRGGEQVKSIKFKNQILDVLANKRSVVVSFSERFAVFDAGTLEDRLAVTTCYPCPCPLGGALPVNPLALGDRWLAYADKKLNQSKRSSGGCEGEGVTSYTATVLHAAKSLSKGLRGLGESVAHSLAGGRSTSQSPSPPNADMQQPGVVTILDIEGNDEDDGQDNEEVYDPIVAHFVAHSDSIIALKFDLSGMLLVTADRRGHDFHVFRVNPHPCGPSLASVHHLYVLHRGDTTAKVQDIAISPDSRWTAVSTLRGTTHVFAISPYGGACGVRTHTSPRVVNRLSRFHRSAGLPIHAHANAHSSGSPVSDGMAQGAWFPNPRLPPYPLPTTAPPLAQLRPTANLPTHTITRTSSGRQRLSSLSEEGNAAPLLARARFGPAPCPAGAGGAAPRAPAVAALYLMAASGCLSHIALHPRPARNVSKEKICDESPIELEVEPIAQWPLQRPPAAADLLAPLPPSNPLLQPLSCRRCADMCMSEEERWLSQVEIVTHAGPHRRLWMGPQFVFKTYNCTGSNSSLSEAETVEVDTSAARSVARSNPVNMPGVRPVVPVLIDSGSASSLEHSPSDSFRRKSLLAESGRAVSVCDVQLKEDLAEAMKEDHGWRAARSESVQRPRGVERTVDPLGTVVAPPRALLPPPADDPDSYTSSNADEATFRPVVRAPASLPLHPDMVVRPLPRNTTIPVQTVSPLSSLSPNEEPLPLSTGVVIPAALTSVQGWHSSNDLDAIETKVTESVVTRIDVAFIEKTADSQTKDAVNDTNYYVQQDKAATIDKSLDKFDKPTIEKDAAKTENSAGLKDELDEKYKTIEKQDTKSNTSAEQDVQALGREVNEDEPRDKTIEPHKRVATDITTKVDRINVDVKKNDVNKDLNPQESDRRKHDSTRERGSVECAERVSDDFKSLPKSNRPSDDIQPTARIRVKKSPTPKSVSDKDSEVSCKEKSKKHSQPKELAKHPRDGKETKDVRELKEAQEPKQMLKEPKEVKESKEVTKQPKEIKEITKQPKELQETKEVNEPQELTKHPTELKETKEIIESKEVRRQPKELKETKVVKEPRGVTKQSKELKDTKEVKETKDIKTQKDIGENKYIQEFREPKQKETKVDRQFKEGKDCRVTRRNDQKYDDTKELVIKDEPSAAMTSQIPFKKELFDTQPKSRDVVEIKTEDQAWDMLLNEPEKPMELNISQQSSACDRNDEKPKSKKNRKSKKIQDDSQGKSEEDSFVEIHAIEENQLPCSGELVSISTPFEDVEPSSSYLSRTKKSRSPKSLTHDKKEDFDDKPVDLLTHEELEPVFNKPRTSKKYEDLPSNIEVFSEPSCVQTQLDFADEPAFSNILKVKRHTEGTSSESTSFVLKEPLKPKSKSLSPYPETRRFSEKPFELADKDVYVINTTEEDFPEIQITRSTKPRKISPQPTERKILEKEPVIEKPVKSWSSIAASKSSKIVETVEKKHAIFERNIEKIQKKDVFKDHGLATVLDENSTSSTKVSLQEKLFKLCKRTDIMVAECDTPSELNFVDEHHSVLHDLPPLEPLEFGLDDFNIEVMRDSLLEVNDGKLASPICKINIDDILSSIKETTAKVIESSTFNLIDLEKVPAKKEKGFSVIESPKITSQEVQLDDDIKPEEADMEKSSDDDLTSPVVSTDSDKEDKKSAGASNLVLPSTKQSAKSKKSRKKKK